MARWSAYVAGGGRRALPRVAAARRSRHSKTLPSLPSSPLQDCIIAHGTANLLHERHYLNSDAYRVHVCDGCGLIAIADLKTMSFKCHGCNTSKVSQVLIPYACKLMVQELMAMQIAPRMFASEDTAASAMS